MFNGRKDILEDSDFSSLRGMQLFNEPDGTQLVALLLQLDPSSKRFEDDEHPMLLHLTDGVSHRLMSVDPLPDVTLLLAKPVATAPAVEPVATPEPAVVAEPAPAPAVTPEPAPAPENPFAGAGSESVGIMKEAPAQGNE